MEQLLLKMDEKSEVKVIAASAFNFRIELVKKVGKDDIPGLIDISQCMADRFGSQALLTKTNIPKYFNSETLPFLARLKGEIIGYIIGVPLEYFKQESWSHFAAKVDMVKPLNEFMSTGQKNRNIILSQVMWSRAYPKVFPAIPKL